MKGLLKRINCRLASSETPWVRGHLARILLKNAGGTPAYPGVFGGCLISLISSPKLLNFRLFLSTVEKWGLNNCDV